MSLFLHKPDLHWFLVAFVALGMGGCSSHPNDIQTPIEVEETSAEEIVETQQLLSCNTQESQESIKIRIINNEIPFNKDYSVYQFSSKKACHKLEEDEYVGSYTKKLSLTVNPCLYFKLLNSNGKSVSACAQARSEKLSFQSYSCGEKRYLIVIAMSEGLNTYGQAIKQALHSVFKNQNIRKPFTIVTIKPGRELSNPLLQCEDLREFDDVTQSINTSFSTIRFGATDLKTLDDLNQVNLSYPLQKLQRILYLTDNSGMPAELKRKDFAIPRLEWHESGIALTVLTTGSCEPWEKQAKAQCTQLVSEPKDSEQLIKTTLHTFLHSQPSQSELPVIPAEPSASPSVNDNVFF
ncbi:MAG: hypothetical protein KAH77_08760 [Thiomargarita sp.]|nr:hypothetical protein [Thiomargarita sp.]